MLIEAEDGSVYFSIAKWPQYGQLVNIDPEQMRSGTRVKLDEYAKSPSRILRCGRPGMKPTGKSSGKVPGDAGGQAGISSAPR